MSTIGVIVASAATLVSLTGVLIQSNAPNPAPAAKPPAHSVANPTASPVQSQADAQPPGRSDIDRQGFVNSYARCGGTQKAVAIGRTDKSLVVVCTAAPGRYTYKGVRLSHGGGVTVEGVTATTNGYVARNDVVTYAVSPTELLITSGRTVVARERMVDYRDPNAAPPRPVARPAKKPEALRLPATANGTGTGRVLFTATAPWQFKYALDCPANVPVRGFVDARAWSGTAYHANLRADSGSHHEGSSLLKNQRGRIVLSISPSDQRCTWAVSIYE